MVRRGVLASVNHRARIISNSFEPIFLDLLKIL